MICEVGLPKERALGIPYSIANGNLGIASVSVSRARASKPKPLGNRKMRETVRAAASALAPVGPAFLTSASIFLGGVAQADFSGSNLLPVAESKSPGWLIAVVLALSSCHATSPVVDDAVAENRWHFYLQSPGPGRRERHC